MKTKDTLAMNATRAIKGEILLFKTSEGGSNKVTDGDILKMTQKLVHCHPILNSDCHRKVNS